jgi:hypothetical protein
MYLLPLQIMYFCRTLKNHDSFSVLNAPAAAENKDKRQLFTISFELTHFVTYIYIYTHIYIYIYCKSYYKWLLCIYIYCKSYYKWLLLCPPAGFFFPWRNNPRFVHRIVANMNALEWIKMSRSCQNSDHEFLTDRLRMQSHFIYWAISNQ